MRFSVATLLFFILIFALYFPASSLFRPCWSGWIENRFPEYCHFEQLKKLKTGDSEEELLAKIPSLKKKAFDQGLDVFVQERYGITADDHTFLITYGSEEYMGVVLLLHHGKLVEGGHTGITNNLAARGVPIPNWWQEGQLPIIVMYLILVGPIIGIWFISRYNLKRRITNG